MCIGAEAERQRLFGEYLLKVGDGAEITVDELGDDYIKVPQDMLLPHQTRAGLIDAIYPDLRQRASDTEYLAQRAILTLKNTDVDSLNEEIIQRMPGEVSG